MTFNGKLDKKALPEPKLERTNKYVEPCTETKKVVISCMKQILGEIQIGATDNFFDLGGDSIKAIHLVSLLYDSGIFVKANDVLKLRTVEKIAKRCKIVGLIEVSQKPIVGEVKDSAIFNFYKDLNLPDKKYFNQSTLLKWNGKINLQNLQRAFDALGCVGKLRNIM